MYCDWPRLGRCCFCMPLRRGVLTCAYINIVFSVFMLGINCYGIHHAFTVGLLVAGRSLHIIPTELSLVFYGLELIFNAVLIYGAHKKILKYVRAYYYYTIVTCVALLLLQILDTNSSNVTEQCIFTVAGLLFQVYLVILVRSLIQDLEVAGPHTYENQLHPIANGDLNVDSNGIYNNTTMIPIDA